MAYNMAISELAWKIFFVGQRIGKKREKVVYLY